MQFSSFDPEAGASANESRLGISEGFAKALGRLGKKKGYQDWKKDSNSFLSKARNMFNPKEKLDSKIFDPTMRESFKKNSY